MRYLELMRPDYDRLQQETAEATRPIETRTILELGTGTGETAHRLLALHAQAELVGVDSSDEMLAAAGRLLDHERVDRRARRIEDALPEGPVRPRRGKLARGSERRARAPGGDSQAPAGR